ncbi:MAG: hypothetical protein WCK34_17535 [Bacteroidota bacterium]
MRKHDNIPHQTETKTGSGKKQKPEGYPLYPVSEDIYNRFMEERDLDPEDLAKSKDSDENGYPGTKNELDFTGDLSGNDLDIPGSELDDQMEAVGSEDEENNYYSLGADGHSELDENKGV